METTLHLVQTSMPLLLIPPWVQVHQSSPQLPITSLRNIKPYKCPLLHLPVHMLKQMPLHLSLHKP